MVSEETKGQSAMWRWRMVSTLGGQAKEEEEEGRLGLGEVVLLGKGRPGSQQAVQRP